MSLQRNKALFQRIRHPFTARHVQLLKREQISPNFIRLTLGGPAMADFKSLGFDDHVKLILPLPGQERPHLPYLVDEKPHMDEPRPEMRDYTPIHYDAEKNTVQLDFALHAGNGPAMQWAKTAPLGQWVGLAGPRGSGVMAPDLDWYVLLGDDTALPAIERFLVETSIAAPITIYLQLGDSADQRSWAPGSHITVHYVDCLAEAADAMALPEGTGFVWGGGENAQMAKIRTLLQVRGLAPQQMHLSAYWRKPD